MSEVYNKDFKRERVRAGMRWFGPEDPVTIRNIRQTPGVTNVISALHHIAPGEIWSVDEISKRKIEVEFYQSEMEPAGLEGFDRYDWYVNNGRSTGLHWDTVESLIFTEEVKNGSPERDLHIENYRISLKNLAEFKISKVIGNFMLVADWTRTEITELDDGSSSLEYIHDRFVAFDLFILKRHSDIDEYIKEGTYTADEVESARRYWEKNLSGRESEIEKLIKMITAGLPGANEGFTLEDFRKAVIRYHGMSVEKLRENIAYFLDAVVPVAEENNIRLCCHADDPSFSPFMGTPRAVGCVEGYKFLIDHGCGVNLCVGSLMANEENRDITSVIYEIAGYGKNKGMDIHQIFPHIHLRPIETDGKNFREGHHAEHREELAKIVHALVDVGWQGVFRPDHAPSPDHGFGRPGYDLIGRGYGAQLLLGLFEMAEITKATREMSIRAAVEASGGDLSKLNEAIKAAAESEEEQIKEKIPLIKMPFSPDLYA